MEVKEEHAIVLGIGLLKCPRSDNDNDNDELFLLNVLTSVRQDRPKTLLEFFVTHWKSYEYHTMRNFSVRRGDDDDENLIEEKVLHREIANLNLFQSDTELKLAHGIHNFMRSLFGRKPETPPCTDFILVWVIQVHRIEFTGEFFGDTTDTITCDSTMTLLEQEDIDPDEDEPFNQVDFILDYLRMLRQDLSLKLVQVRDSIQIHCLEIDVVSTQDGGYGYFVEEKGVVEEEGCSICLARFEGELLRQDEICKWLPEDHSWSLVRLKCGHVFHHGCIFNWLPKHPTCPYCRSTTLTFF